MRKATMTTALMSVSHHVSAEKSAVTPPSVLRAAAGPT